MTGIEPAPSAWEVSSTVRGLPADSLTCSYRDRLSVTDRELPCSLIGREAGTITAPQAAPEISRVCVSHRPELGRLLAEAQ